jgi:hypothetical protein
MKMNALIRNHQRFNTKHFPFCLWRLRDHEYDQLKLHSFSIKINDFLIFQLALEEHNTPNELTLPKALLVLEANFGQSSTYLDSWKQTFAFPLLLGIEKPSGTFYYLLKITDCRGGLEFWFRRVMDNLKYVDKNDRFSQPPIADELSDDEINYIIAYLWGFMKGYAKSLGTIYPIQPFFRHVDSSHIIYGYWDGKFVEEVIEDSEQYQQMVQHLESLYNTKPSDLEQVSQTQALIQSITQASLES